MKLVLVLFGIWLSMLSYLIGYQAAWEKGYQYALTQAYYQKNNVKTFQIAGSGNEGYFQIWEGRNH